MYNGIGIVTPRGSGTSGYVQASKFHLKASRLLPVRLPVHAPRYVRKPRAYAHPLRPQNAHPGGRRRMVERWSAAVATVHPVTGGVPHPPHRDRRVYDRLTQVAPGQRSHARPGGWETVPSL
jgi:hypothetical protein